MSLNFEKLFESLELLSKSKLFFPIVLLFDVELNSQTSIRVDESLFLDIFDRKELWFTISSFVALLINKIRIAITLKILISFCWMSQLKNIVDISWQVEVKYWRSTHIQIY